LKSVAGRETLYEALGMPPQLTAARRVSRSSTRIARSAARHDTWSPVLKKLIALATSTPHDARHGG
jgi:hypothetical protein